MTKAMTLEAFEARTKQEDQAHASLGTKCIVWIGARNAKGYGRVWVNDVQVSTHRVAWEMKVGPIPDGMMVLHKCDNPPCVNVDHLFIGNTSDNAIDMVRKGRAPTIFKAGGPNPRRKLSDDDLVRFAELYAMGFGSRRLAKEFSICISAARDRMRQIDGKPVRPSKLPATAANSSKH